jgi:hypothetical protein
MVANTTAALPRQLYQICLLAYCVVSERKNKAKHATYLDLALRFALVMEQYIVNTESPIVNITHHFLELSTFVSPYLRQNDVRDSSCTYKIDTPCDRHHSIRPSISHKHQ